MSTTETAIVDKEAEARKAHAREIEQKELERTFAETEHSLSNRIEDSGLFWIHDGGNPARSSYVGIPDGTNPHQHPAPLASHRPEKGTLVVLHDDKGEEFVFALRDSHETWDSVVIPESGGFLIPRQADPEKTKSRRLAHGLDKPQTELERINTPEFQDALRRERTAPKSGESTGDTSEGEKSEDDSKPN